MKILAVTLAMLGLAVAGAAEAKEALRLEVRHAVVGHGVEAKPTVRGHIVITRAPSGGWNATFEPTTTAARLVADEDIAADSLYTLDMAPTGAGPETERAMHSLPAKALCDVAAIEHVTVLLDANGAFDGFNYELASASETYEGTCALAKTTEGRTLPTIKVKIPTAPPQTFAVPLPSTSSPAAPPVDDRGFFARYWMYLIPLGIVLVANMASEAPREAGANRG